MSRMSIYDCFPTRQTINDRQLGLLSEFFVTHRDLILDHDHANALFKSRPLTTSSLSKIFSRAIEMGDESLFSVLVIPSGQVSVPEALTMRHVPFDTDQMASVMPSLRAVFQPISALNNKIVLNATQMVRASGGFSDIAGFQNTFVRDLLSRSYFADRKTTWLTPVITQFVSKVYSMSLGSEVAKTYNLDYHTQSMISVLFAFFFLSAMSDADVAAWTIKTRYKYFYLPSVSDIEQILSLVEETLGYRDLKNIDDIFTVIEKFDVARLKLDRKVLMTRMKALGPDIYTTLIAMEYPPYFLYLILLVLSGAKIGLSFRMKTQNLMKDAASLTEDLIQSSGFIGQLSDL